MNRATEAREQPWYREVWPWALMLPPAFAVVGGLIMVYLSASVPNSLVVDDYSRIEEITRRRFERDRHAAELGLTAQIAVSAGENGDAGLTITLGAPAGWIRPEAAVVRFRHAADARADRQVVAPRYGDRYRTDMELPPGRYRIELTAPDETWRLAGSLSRIPATLSLVPDTGAVR